MAVALADRLMLASLARTLPPAAAAALLLGLSASDAPAAEGMPAPAHADAYEVLADLMLIDGTCRDVTVNFGAGFRFAAGQGVSVADTMPGGSQRSWFERVLRERRASFGRDELCGEIAENYAEALPGSVTQSFRRVARP